MFNKFIKQFLQVQIRILPFCIFKECQQWQLQQTLWLYLKSVPKSLLNELLKAKTNFNESLLAKLQSLQNEIHLALHIKLLLFPFLSQVDSYSFSSTFCTTSCRSSTQYYYPPECTIKELLLHPNQHVTLLFNGLLFCFTPMRVF